MKPPVLNRAEVELSLGGGLVLGNVGEPELVRAVSGELMPRPPVLIDHSAKIVVDRGSGFLNITASFLPKRATPRVATADPPRSPVRHRLTGITGLVGQEPMPKLRIITVGIKQCVRAIGPGNLAFGDLRPQPPIVRLTR